VLLPGSHASHHPVTPCLQAAATSQHSEQGSAAALAADKAAAVAAAERGAAEVARLRGELAHLQRMMTADDVGSGGSASACFNRTSIADISDSQVRRPPNRLAGRLVAG
jgi:hypothetical protein